MIKPAVSALALALALAACGNPAETTAPSAATELTADQKAELIRGVTQLLVDVLGKNPATTVVVIDEVDTDNWGIGGETVTVRRARGS